MDMNATLCCILWKSCQSIIVNGNRYVLPNWSSISVVNETSPEVIFNQKICPAPVERCRATTAGMWPFR